jgi:hypothetical protein
MLLVPSRKRFMEIKSITMKSQFHGRGNDRRNVERREEDIKLDSDIELKYRITQLE